MAQGFSATSSYRSTATIGYNINGGNAAISTGVAGLGIQVPFGCTISSVTVVADQTGSISIDIWKAPLANYPPVVGNSICGSSYPTITSNVKYTDSNLTGWTTAITADDFLFYNVRSCSTIQNATVILKVVKT